MWIFVKEFVDSKPFFISLSFYERNSKIPKGQIEIVMSEDRKDIGQQHIPNSYDFQEQSLRHRNCEKICHF